MKHVVDNTWQPNASINNLFTRASIIATIRRFFSDRNILEVDTPSLSQATVPDVHIDSFQTTFFKPGVRTSKKELYLITSPEYHMKRLLVAGIGPIYQICHCFRNRELGPLHNPEFTMLEWYRPQYNIYQLMNEVNELIDKIIHCGIAEKISYQDVFIRHLNIDPLATPIKELKQIVKLLPGDSSNFINESYDTLLQLLLSHLVTSLVEFEKPIFIYNFPISQASLATINLDDERVAERFELYYQGVELANGFQELTDSIEHRRRFECDNNIRTIIGKNKQPIDNKFLTAIKQGLPRCSGVSLGVDRLIMIALKIKELRQVITFSIDRC
ncbi:MAG: elongation factor P--(R)-beta-lysine ligase [Candidatus Dasytiphilus stammeri]